MPDDDLHLSGDTSWAVTNSGLLYDAKAKELVVIDTIFTLVFEGNGDGLTAAVDWEGFTANVVLLLDDIEVDEGVAAILLVGAGMFCSLYSLTPARKDGA